MLYARALEEERRSCAVYGHVLLAQERSENTVGPVPSAREVSISNRRVRPIAFGMSTNLAHETNH